MKCIVLIPIYKPSFSSEEFRNVRFSLDQLKSQNCEISWLAPSSLDRAYYSREFPSIEWSIHPDIFFKSVSGYSRLLLSDEFYKEYYSYEFMLILQPDAVILRPTLNEWLETPYDYIGAPWPSGWQYHLPIRFSSGVRSVEFRAFVGNGGLSLRRPKRIVQLFHEFPEARSLWRDAGNPEDLLISMVATLSKDFITPSIGVASQFSIELDFDFLFELAGELPFGVHEMSLTSKLIGT